VSNKEPQPEPPSAEETDEAKTKKLTFAVLRPGLVRPEADPKVLARVWRKSVDRNQHLSIIKIYEASGLRQPETPCSNCGAQVITATRAPAIRFKAGTYGPGWDKPGMAVCDACGGSERPSEAIERLHNTVHEQLSFMGKHCGGAKPPELAFDIARYGDAVTMDLDTLSATQRVQPPDHDCTVELCRVLAIDEPIEVLKNAADLPLVKVPTNPQGHVLKEWHGMPLNGTERGRLEAARREVRRRGEAEIEREVAAFRADLAQRQRA
jgi:hypothetical protein